MGGDGVGCPQATFVSLKEHYNFPIFNQMNPIHSLNDNSFHKNLICYRDTIYNPCPLVLRGYFNPEGLFVSSLDYFEQNSNLKILVRCIWKKKRRRVGLVALLSLLIFKKDARTSGFQLNVGHQKFTLSVRTLNINSGQQTQLITLCPEDR